MITNQRTAPTGRHRYPDTQVIALPPVAPMHGRLSRPRRPVPAGEPTTAMPAVRVLPPLTPDRADRLRLTRRGRQVRAALLAALAVGACLVIALATRGQVLTWVGWQPVPH